jgi:hypothetical protein
MAKKVGVQEHGSEDGPPTRVDLADKASRMNDGRPFHEGQILTGPLFNEPMRVETVTSEQDKEQDKGTNRIRGQATFSLKDHFGSC